MSGTADLRGYRIIKPLGEGGMGAVFIAEKTATHQKYAVKFLKEEYARDETYLARFDREVSSLVSIRHPHVVNVFDWWVPGTGQEGKPFVVMELLEGEGLDQLLRRQKILPPSAAVAIMMQTLDGLQAAHRIGVIHRDLGPSNLFLVTTNDPQPLVKILDFGLARPITPDDEEAASNLTRAGTLMGKPAYIAPEMFLEQPLDARSDIFACGMVLFRMLAGRTPFRNTQTQTLWMERYTGASQGGELPSIAHFASWVSAPLEQVVTRALRQRPEDRYADAAEMQAALITIEGGLLDQKGTRPVDFLRPGGRELSSPSMSSASLVPSSPGSTAPRPSVISSPSRPSLASLAPIQASSKSTYLALGALGVSVAAAGALLYLAGVFGGKEDPAASPPAVATTADAGPIAVPVEGDMGPAESSGLIRLVFEGVPEGGKVSIGSLEITAPPFEIAFEVSNRPLPVMVVAPGFKSYRVAVTPDEDQVVLVRMDPFPTADPVPEPEPADAGVAADDSGGRRPTSSSGSSGGRPDGGTRPTERDAGTRPAFVEDPFR